MNVSTNHRSISATKVAEIERRLVITLVVGSEHVNLLRSLFDRRSEWTCSAKQARTKIGVTG